MMGQKDIFLVVSTKDRYKTRFFCSCIVESVSPREELKTVNSPSICISTGSVFADLDSKLQFSQLARKHLFSERGQLNMFGFAELCASLLAIARV